MNSFKRNLLLGYSLSLLLLIISSVASYISIDNLLSSQRMVSHTNEVISKVENALSILKDAETGQRGFLLTGNEVFLEPYNGSFDKAVNLIKATQELTKDNPEQQLDLASLNYIVIKRLNVLSGLIDKKRKNEEVTEAMLLDGKSYMDQARVIVKKMQGREQALLENRTNNMNRFASYTPVLILIASILSIIVTLISFYRVLRDYEKRARLQTALSKKDEEISNRIGVISRIADQISAGDYKTVVSDVGTDDLGVIAGSLNKMTKSLDYSFSNLKDKEWMQTGIAQLNELMIGEKDIELLCKKILRFITDYSGSQVGAFYIAQDEDHLTLISGIALNQNSIKKNILFGEGFAGKSAATHEVLLLENIDKAEILINHTAGSLKPRSVCAIPVVHENKLKAVIELASLHKHTTVILDFLKTGSVNIGMAMNSARDHQHLQELLAETQAQSEELQSQHNELENINSELEAQAEKLQASEEELKVQQEELQQANQELEERSRDLEEKNELIVERNLEIQQKADDLAVSTKYKSEFLANMSHELRTPLNSILLLSRLLSENHETNLSADQVEYANVIQTSGKGLLSLIDEILDLSKIESGKMELEYTDVNLENFAGDLKSLFAPIAKDKEINFSIDVDKSAPGIFETDRMRLEQILRNLISNALKFTKKGSVSVSIKKEGNSVSFAVKDTGIGIPPDKQQTVFEAFQQADGSTRRQYGGTGLGLSISRELARLLGGEIKLSSEESKGSEFTFIVPLTKSSSADIAATNTHTPLPVLDEAKEVPEKADKKYISENIPLSVPDDRGNIEKDDKCILIIEDDTGFARSLLDYTRRKGYKGIVAVRGDEGLELARQYLPMGILLDVQLPIKNGWEVMDALKANESTRPIPVHMMSSYEVKTKSLSKGAVDFINKPVAFEKLGEMFQKIEQALNRYPKKVLIMEENTRHAKALAYFLETYGISAEIKNSVPEGVSALNRSEVDCVILDMGIPAQHSYDLLEKAKKTPGMENLPIIVFTGKNLSHVEEMKIKQYADTIVVKTAHSYQRILDEVSLFLHLVEENKKSGKTSRYKKMGELGEVLKGRTILVADDDVRNIFSLTKSLENYGMHVISAIDGKDALKQLNEHDNVDLVLMDMMMPEMDGYESTKQIRGIPTFRNLPVIAVTAKAMTGDREKCIAAGASDYITKPVDVDQLISLLRVWLYDNGK